MKRIIIITSAILLSVSASAQYYKDLFMDGGMYLTSRKNLPAAEYLNIQMERYYSAPTKELTPQDSLVQESYFVGNANDENGVLLYPDGAPRFRAIYVNGGKAGTHGRTLTEVGRQRVRDFYNNGGSYIGTCAGAYIATKGGSTYDKKCEENFDLTTARCVKNTIKKPRVEYFGIYPAKTMATRLGKSRTDMTIPEDSPLLKYYDFGGDNHIDSVYHNGGCFFTLNPFHFPEGAEVCAYYQDYPDSTAHRLEKGKFDLTGKISIVAYKTSPVTGRMVLCGSHPEGVSDGERRDLFASFIRYALDGNGVPSSKGELEQGKVRKMIAKTSDNDPAYTRIGDKQYHHFTVEIPEGAKNVKIEVKGGKKGFKECYLNLYMKQGGFAFASDCDYSDVTEATGKTLTFETLPAGTWYIAVEGATTVEAYQTEHGEEYCGHIEVLNGVPYTIKASWK